MQLLIKEIKINVNVGAVISRLHVFKTYLAIVHIKKVNNIILVSGLVN